MEKLLTAREVAVVLGVKNEYVIAHASGRRAPRLPSIWLGRFRRFRSADIENFVEAQGDHGDAASKS